MRTIETHALMIEGFDEIANDRKAVEDCKVWLLKQKQTQDWKTTKATADAVYALLLRGRDLLASDALVGVKSGGIEIKPRHTGPAGSGPDAPGAVGPEENVSLAGVDLQVDVPKQLPLAQFYLEILNEKHPCLLCKVLTRFKRPSRVSRKAAEI